MATLLQNGEQTFLDSNGSPLAGGSVYFYIPNTTTFKNTWQDPGATILNTNPVVLDSAGRAIIYGVGAYRQVVKDSLGNTIWDQLTADISGNLPSGPTLPSGPQTYQEFVDTSTTPPTLKIYDGTDWVAVGQLDTTNHIWDIVESNVVGTLSFSGAAINETTATLASAATVNIGAAAANYLQVTGTTTITAFDTIQAGTRRILEFEGALTLTHNATSLILPGAANIATAAGDVAIMLSEGSGNWRCTNYTKANGKAVVESKESVATLAYQQASGTGGGSTTASAWTDYPLNAESSDPDGIVSLNTSTGELTLGAGTYIITANAVINATNISFTAKLRLLNTTSSTTIAVGTNVSESSAGSASAVCSLESIPVTLSGSTTLKLQYYVSSAQTSSGLGNALSSGEGELYGYLHIRKLP